MSSSNDSDRDILTGKKTRAGNDPWDEILEILDTYEEGVQPRSFKSLEEGDDE